MAQISHASAMAALQTVIGQLNYLCHISVYTGNAPSNCELPSSGTLLYKGEYTSNTGEVFAPVSDGGGKAVSSLNTQLNNNSGVVLAKGPPGHIRVSVGSSSRSSTVFMATAGGPNSNKECIFNNSYFNAFDRITILSLSVEMNE